jgi:quercetin dioxygenase-like cupin family protein
MQRFFLVALLLGSASLIDARQGSSIDPTAVAVDQEPRHHLVFANDFVRIIDAVFPGFYVSQNHTHSLDHATVVILSGRDDAQGQARVGFAGFAKGGYSHVVTSPESGVMRFIDVEMRAPDHGEGDEDPQDAHVPVLNNSRVRMTRVKLEAGQSLTGHHHVDGYVAVVVRGGEGPGTWSWHPSGEPPMTVEAGRQRLEFVEIQPK